MRQQQQPLPSIAARGPVLAALAAALLAMSPVMTLAQDIFPPNEPRQIFAEDAGVPRS